jgi:multiple antibiotic resistance protein
MTLLSSIGLAFVPLLAAMNPLGKIPVFISLTQNADVSHARRVMRQAIVVSLLIALVFTLIGRYVFDFLSIRTEDFQIGVGLLLFALAVADMLNLRRRNRPSDVEVVGVCPLATPLIAGPALLTTLLLMVDKVGSPATLIALGLNVLVMWVALRSSVWLTARLGRPALVGLSKVMMILLAAIGVMMVRKGIMYYVQNG